MNEDMVLIEAMYEEANICHKDNSNQYYYRWDNLIHVDLIFYIDGNIEDVYIDYLFKDEVLWERGNTSIEDIKEFAVTFILENLKPAIRSKMTYDYVECIWIFFKP
jgi:hypothetical protein